MIFPCIIISKSSVYGRLGRPFIYNKSAYPYTNSYVVQIAQPRIIKPSLSYFFITPTKLKQQFPYSSEILNNNCLFIFLCLSCIHSAFLHHFKHFPLTTPCLCYLLTIPSNFHIPGLHL